MIKGRHRCEFCGLSGGEKDERLQAHHIVRRGRHVLRWDWRNGIALCHDCHRLAHTKIGEARIREIYGEGFRYLEILEQVTLFEHCGNLGLTSDEFRIQKRDELQEIIGGERD